MVNDVECGEPNGDANGVAATQRFGANKPPLIPQSTPPFMGSQPSIAECWRWLKGLLYDFINLKKESYKLEKNIEKANNLNKELNLQIAKRNKEYNKE